MKERKSSRPEGLVQVRPSPARPGPALNREIQTKIGQQLRAVYDDIVDQGVPLGRTKRASPEGIADIRLTSALVAFALFEAAYYSEIIRAGIQSVPKGQVAAGLALGLTPGQTMRLVVLPQAFRNMVPLLLTQAIILFQDTSLVYVIGLSDFFGTAYKVGDRDGRLVELLLFAGAVYFVLCFSASQLVRRLQARYVK